MTIETGMHYPLNLRSLPQGWRFGFVGDFAKKIESGFASGEHNALGDGIPHLRPMNVSRNGALDFDVVKHVDPRKGERRLQLGDVLFNNTNSAELVGKTAVVNHSGEFAFSNHMTRITFGDDVIPKFAAIQLHFLWMRGYFQYNCVKHVNQASVSSTALARSVPFVWAPPETQARIIAEIEKQFSRLDEAVANLKRVKANLKRYKASVLKAAVEGRLVPTEAELARIESRDYQTGSELLIEILDIRKKKYGAKGKLNEVLNAYADDLPDLPEGWRWTSVAQVAEETLIGLDRGRDGQNVDGVGVPYIKMNNVTIEGEVVLDNLVFVEADSDDCARYAIADGDMLFNTRNSKELVGKIGIVRNPPKGAIYNNNLMRIRVFDGVSPAFICAQMCAFDFRRRMERVKKATTNVAAVYAKDLLPLPLALPPKHEQLRIVVEMDRRFSLIRGVEAQNEANLKRAERLRQAVLSKVFAG